MSNEVFEVLVLHFSDPAALAYDSDVSCISVVGWGSWEHLHGVAGSALDASVY